MFRQKEDSYHEEGNGYRINNVPSDANYNTCSVKYTLNNNFYMNPRAHYKDSTNTHTKRLHTDVNASTNEQRPSGADCSRPMSSQRSSGMGTQRAMNTQRTFSTARPVVKKASPIGLFILPIIFFLIVIFAIIGKGATPFIGLLVAVAVIFSSKNKTTHHR